MGKKRRKSVFYAVSGYPILGCSVYKSVEKAVSFKINDLQATFSTFSTFLYIFSTFAGTVEEIEKAYKAFLFLRPGVFFYG